MSISAADVKRLREETDAPMMDCKRALEEANGDFERAKEILREKGAAASQKKAGRATKEGIARVLVSDDKSKAAAVVVECETDFVSRNEEFKAMVNDLAKGILEAGAADPDVKVGDKTIAEHITEAVGRIRENIQLRVSDFIDAGDAKLASYNHHDGKWASLVLYTGDNHEAAEKVAVQVVAGKPAFLTKEDVPQEVVDKEYEFQKKRALEEGKPENVAENIARGRIDKEFYKEQVLLEQLIYLDNKTRVGEYLSQNGGGSVSGYHLFAVGLGADGTEEE